MNKELSEHESRQKDYYDRINKTYDKHHFNKYAMEYRYRLYDRVCGQLELEGKHILDAMCGGGESTGYFMSRKAVVSALDLSEEQCRLYSSRYPNNTFRCKSIINTGFPDKSFDIVFTDSLHHTHPRVNDAMNEIHRILKPGGYLIAWEPNAASYVDRARQLWYKLDRRFFQSNEQSININTLISDNRSMFRATKIIYGGNLAYLLVQESMLFRIPVKIIPLYAALLLKAEDILNVVLGRPFSCWVFALIQKI